MHRRSFLTLTGATALGACATRLNTTPTEPADLGVPATADQIVERMARPGRLGFEKIVVADWHFPNTTRPPGVSEWAIRELDAQIYFYAIRHPERGLYFIDAGMPADYERYMGAILRNAVRDTYDFSLHVSTDAWVRENGAPRAAFITHLHYDHVLGVAALDRATPIYIGPNDGAHRNFFYRFINQPTREALEGPSVRTLRFGPAPEGGLAALDVFGDGLLFALHVPGHTPGSTAYFVNATQGPQLITGDAVHSREGWTGELEEATGCRNRLGGNLRVARFATSARRPHRRSHCASGPPKPLGNAARVTAFGEKREAALAGASGRLGPVALRARPPRRWKPSTRA